MTRETPDRIRKFIEDREWEQFHTPANLAKSISIEANELLECFQWSDTDYDLNHVKEELADVMVYCRVHSDSHCEQQVAETFDLPKNHIPVMMFAMGYPSDKTKPSPWHFQRKSIEETVVKL